MIPLPSQSVTIATNNKSCSDTDIVFAVKQTDITFYSTDADGATFI